MKTGKVSLIIAASFLAVVQFASCESNTTDINDKSVEETEIKGIGLEERITSKKWIGDSIPDAYSTKKEWTDSVGIFHWTLESHKSPVLLSFIEDKAILEVPKIEGVFELADIVHRHGTSLAGKEPKFEYDYEIDESDSTITLIGGFTESDIELKIQNGQLKWPLWKSSEFMTFKERK